MIIGKSLGSVAVIRLCAQQHTKKIGGLVLTSPLASGARCVIPPSTLKTIKNWSTTCLNQLDNMFTPNLNIISSVECPVFITHGVDDKIVTIQNSYLLVDRCMQCKSFLPMWVDAGHNDIEARYTKYFLERTHSFFLHCKEPLAGLIVRSRRLRPRNAFVPVKLPPGRVSGTGDRTGTPSGVVGGAPLTVLRKESTLGC